MGPAFHWEECPFAAIFNTTGQLLIVLSAVRETKQGSLQEKWGCVAGDSFKHLSGRASKDEPR